MVCTNSKRPDQLCICALWSVHSDQYIPLYINLFMLSGLFYHNSLDQSISKSQVSGYFFFVFFFFFFFFLVLLCFIEILAANENSLAPEQTLQNALFPNCPLWVEGRVGGGGVSRLKWVNRLGILFELSPLETIWMKCPRLPFCG